MSLLTTDNILHYLNYYDSRKGFLRRLFGDDSNIQSLRFFYDELKSRKVNTLSFTDQVRLLTILNQENKYNPRLSGHVLRSLLSNVSYLSLVVTHKTENTEINPENFKKNEQTIVNILKNIESIGELTKSVVQEVLNHPNLNHLEIITRCLLNKPYINTFNESQLIAMFKQSELYQDTGLLPLLVITPKELLTREAIDTMIKAGKHEGLIGVVGFLNRLIHFSNEEILEPPIKRSIPLPRESTPPIRAMPQYPSRFNLWNFFKDFGENPNQAKITEITNSFNNISEVNLTDMKIR